MADGRKDGWTESEVQFGRNAVSFPLRLKVTQLDALSASPSSFILDTKQGLASAALKVRGVESGGDRGDQRAGPPFKGNLHGRTPSVTSSFHTVFFKDLLANCIGGFEVCFS